LTETKDKTANSRKANERRRKRDDGLRPVEVWVSDTPEAVAAIRQAEAEIIKKYPPVAKNPLDP